MKGTARGRWIGFTVGLLTFSTAHAIETVMWSRWFGAAHDPWFLNSGLAALFTLGLVSAASGTVALLNVHHRKVRGVTIGAGSFVAMTAVMFLKKEGPGTIFPIAIVAGGVFILMSSTLGAWTGTEIGNLARRRQ